MAKIRWYAHIVDLETDDIVASTTEIVNPSFGSTSDTYGRVHAEFRPGTDFHDALITAWGGPTYRGEIKAYLFEMFMNGGSDLTEPDCSMWVETGQVNLAGDSVGVVLDGVDIASGFDRSYIDEATYVNCRIEDVLGAPAGGVRVQPGSLMLAGSVLPPWWQGFYSHVPGRNDQAGNHRLAFTCITSPTLSGHYVNTEIDTDSILSGTTNAVASASGVYDPENPNLFGASQHFHFDTMHRKVYAGYRGDVSVLKLRGDIKPSEADESVEAAIVDGERNFVKPDLSKKFAQTEWRGGSTTHGMPAGGSFTDVCIINKPASGDSIGEYDNLILLAISTGDGGGGVFTWLGDGVLRRLSQAIDVTSLKLDGTMNQLYMGTPHGLFTRNTAAPYGQEDWAEVSTTDFGRYEFTKIWIPEPGIIYAVASGSNNGAGVNGVWRFEAGAGRKIIAASNMIDASGSDTDLYYVVENSPSTVIHTSYPNSGGLEPRLVAGVGNSWKTGLDFDATDGDVIIRTELGASEFYRVSGLVAIKADPTGSLRDGFGPLAIAQFVDYVGTVNGQGVHGMVLTDRGLYWRSSVGGAFAPTDGQSGIQNVNGTSFAIGETQTIMGRLSRPIVIIVGSYLYISRDGGLHFREEMAQELDAGPAWYEAVKRFSGTYPKGDVAAFGTILAEGFSGTPGFDDTDSKAQAYDPSDQQGNGRVVLVPAGDVLALPDNWIVARRWTANCTFTYRMLDSQSNAPYNATKPAEVVDIQADDSRSVLDASGAVMTAMYRYLSQASQPMIALTLTVAHSLDTSKVRYSKTGDRMTVDYYVAYRYGEHESVLLDFEDVDMIAIDKQSYVGEDNANLVDYVLVNDAAYNFLDVDKIMAALANTVSKQHRTRKAKIR